MDTLDRLRRSISFHPVPNDFYYPRCRVNGRAFDIENFDLASGMASGNALGKVLDMGESGIDVAAADSVVTLTTVIDDTGKRISIPDLILTYKIEASCVIVGYVEGPK